VNLLYARVLGAHFTALPAAIRELHAVQLAAAFEGRATVERGRGLLSRLVARVIGFPHPADDVDVVVRFDVRDGTETWTRNFAGRRFSSRQFAGAGGWQGLLCESFGPLCFAFALVPQQDRLTLQARGWRAFGLPLPSRWGPWLRAFETVEQGRFCFDVTIGHPLTGLIVHYRGWLVPTLHADRASDASSAARPS
jgi:hypothetical protein